MKKLVIIPAFNESGSILRAVQDIKEHAPGFDYVVINDCSTDDTLQVCQKNGLNHVNLSVNLGIGGAVQTGYLYGCQNHYDVAVQFDGDGQHDAAYLEHRSANAKIHGKIHMIQSVFLAYLQRIICRTVVDDHIIKTRRVFFYILYCPQNTPTLIESRNNYKFFHTFFFS
jgi:glycosyltransferase involved in cell wall biosynthesis